MGKYAELEECSNSWRRGRLMAVSKFSTIPTAAIILVLMCVEAIRRRQKLLAKHVVAVVALSCLIICFAYNFHVARFSFANGLMDAHFQHREQDWVMPVPFKTSFTVYVPGGDFIDGLGAVYRHNRDGHGSHICLARRRRRKRVQDLFYLGGVVEVAEHRHPACHRGIGCPGAAQDSRSHAAFGWRRSCRSRSTCSR